MVHARRSSRLGLITGGYATKGGWRERKSNVRHDRQPAAPHPGQSYTIRHRDLQYLRKTFIHLDLTITESVFAAFRAGEEVARHSNTWPCNTLLTVICVSQGVLTLISDALSHNATSTAFSAVSAKVRAYSRGTCRRTDLPRAGEAGVTRDMQCLFCPRRDPPEVILRDSRTGKREMLESAEDHLVPGWDSHMISRPCSLCTASAPSPRRG